MKSFSVNKNSWHYKLNYKMCSNEHLYTENLKEKYIMSKDNLCSYWQMTFWNVFKVALVTFFTLSLLLLILSLIFMYGYGLIFNTAEVIAGTVVFLTTLAIILGVIAAGAWFDKRKKTKLDKILSGETETSLTKAKYKSWKSGICLPVEFKE